MIPFLLQTDPTHGGEAAAHGAEHAGEAHAPFDMAELILGHLFGTHGGPYEVAPGFAWLDRATAGTWANQFVPTKMVFMMWLAGLAVVLLFTWVARRAKAADKVPEGAGYNLFEVVLLFLRDEVALPSLGEDHIDRFVPWVWTFFFFILACNLFGLVPGAVTATGNIFVTATLAGLAFVVFNMAGMREQGVVGYWTGLVPHGVPLLLWPLLFVVEILGLIAKTVALAIRLFANMVGGHATILALYGLIFMAASTGAGLALGVSVPVVLTTVGIYLLEIIIALIQAYIFTYLFAIFLGMSLHPHH